jgi:hypothetical protein
VNDHKTNSYDKSPTGSDTRQALANMRNRNGNTTTVARLRGHAVAERHLSRRPGAPANQRNSTGPDGQKPLSTEDHAVRDRRATLRITPPEESFSCALMI